ncbi:hypothetical protein B0H15DRAFT_801204 [Mycena belliarum]|uniref:Uncharacterized protein n=1 Tax=Mycena belliarum TaxID=1033014 RepID=A0AAD6XU53_9AGAR|nr:hypothetical protein B0H15DRAFT_801204 [Mycena belliae]
MVLIVPYDSPFAAAEPPPPPAVVLLIHTDLDLPTESADLLIHEDLGLAPTAKKAVQFAHKYPPPPIFDKLIPSPGRLSRLNLDNTPEWKQDHTPKDTALIKAVIHRLVDKLLDTTKAISFQDKELVEQVYREGAAVYPILCQYENNWATYCIVHAHLKYTSTEAIKKAADDRLEKLEEAVAAVGSGPGPRTRAARTAQTVAN